MNPNQAAYACLILAFFLSNLPFLGRRRQATRQRPAKKLEATPVRLAVWLILYGVWIAATIAAEKSLGSQVPKDWSIWPISIAFFAVLAFPGIVYRYLWRS